MSKYVNDDPAGIEVHLQHADGRIEKVDAKDAPAAFKRRAAKGVKARSNIAKAVARAKAMKK